MYVAWITPPPILSYSFLSLVSPMKFPSLLNLICVKADYAFQPPSMATTRDFVGESEELGVTRGSGNWGFGRRHFALEFFLLGSRLLPQFRFSILWLMTCSQAHQNCGKNCAYKFSVGFWKLMCDVPINVKPKFPNLLKIWHVAQQEITYIKTSKCGK